MPIPKLIENGLLPPGIYDCSLEEIERQFGQFTSTDRRCQLYEKLQSFVKEVITNNIAVALIVDGSFVTNKPDPGDIDIILVLPQDHDFVRDLRPVEYNLISKKRVRKRFQFDLLVAQENSPEYEEYTNFFQQVRGQPEYVKGILRIKL